MRLKQVVCVLAFLISCGCLNAQTCCTGGAPVVGVLNTKSLEAGAKKLVLTYDYNSIDDIVVNSRRSRSETLEREVQTVVTQFEYALSPKYAVGFLAPYVWKNETTNTAALSAAGIGDLMLFVSRRDSVLFDWTLSLTLGLKLPTGAVNRSDEGFILPPSLQIGTGSFDQQFLVSLSGRPLRSSNLLVNAVLSYRRNSEANGLASHTLYRFGNELQFFFTAQNQFLFLNQLITPSLGFEYRSTPNNRIETLDDVNSGGHWGYATVALSIEPSASISFFVGSDLPVYQNLQGFQLTTDLRWRSGVYITL